MQEVLDFGIDVAKAELVIGVAGHPEWNTTISNTAVHIRRWLRQVPLGSRIAVESTGPYHSLLVELAQACGFATYVLNARDVHFYAKALGQRGKTDRTDAQVISRYVHEHHDNLYPFNAGSLTEQEVNRLLRRRAALVVQRGAVAASLQGLSSLATPVQGLMAQFNRVLAAIDEQVAVLIHSQTDLAVAAKRLQTIPGIGPQGAALLTCLFRRIGFHCADAVVAFSGLDPRPMDSGQKHGKRRLSKRGPSLLRRQLFMTAFAASRSKVFKPTYQALRARGLSTTETFVILGRKLLRIAFAVWRTTLPFDSGRWITKNACVEL